uniref:ATP synthase complex subunit 8 n=1 Tax=Stygiocaris stylifera TaxID=481988 RepID=A0A1Z2R7B4_STYST|nr:ATP synthase F0 subunit 8 [Stygiocaris stylifera]ASA39609.1 ATP synthase F0 subunit 8 [Stygiocaris stylifera]
MPQMAPLFWLNLFIFFSVSFMLFLIMNYFLPPFSKTKPITLPTKSKKLYWKW